MKDQTLMARSKVIQAEKSMCKEMEIYECQWHVRLIIAKGQDREWDRKFRSGQVSKSYVMLDNIDLLESCIRILRKTNQYALQQQVRI